MIERIPTGTKCSYYLTNGSQLCVRIMGPGDPMEPGWQPVKILTRGSHLYRYGHVTTVPTAHLVPRSW